LQGQKLVKKGDLMQNLLKKLQIHRCAREGGFVNDPDDAGWGDQHGVTIHTMRRLGLDLNRDGR